MALPQERGGPFVWDAGVRREEGNVSAQTHKRDPAALVLGFFLSRFFVVFFPGRGARYPFPPPVYFLCWLHTD